MDTRSTIPARPALMPARRDSTAGEPAVETPQTLSEAIARIAVLETELTRATAEARRWRARAAILERSL